MGSLSKPVAMPVNASLAGIFPRARQSLIAANSIPSNKKKNSAE